MLMQAQATIRGAKMFKGNLDGKDIDSAKLFVEVVLKESDNSFGMCTEPVKCKSSEIVQGIKHLTFPFIAEMDVEIVSGSKGMEQTIIAVRPIKAIKDGLAPAAARAGS